MLGRSLRIGAQFCTMIAEERSNPDTRCFEGGGTTGLCEDPAGEIRKSKEDGHHEE